MKLDFVLGDKTHKIKAYNTFQEKEILLLSSLGVEDLTKILDILEFKDYDDLSKEELKVILYKHREISIGDEINIKFKCKSCGRGSDGVLNASDFVIPSKRNDPDIKKILTPFNEDNMQSYVDIDVDELDIDEYELLKQRILDNQNHISFDKEIKCFSCGGVQKFYLGDDKYIIEIMSDETLMTIYKSYNFLNFFGHYSKQDIDSMYPFERSIFIGLLKKTKEDLSK